jgi:Fe2+ or Zn2+ uptake regulation protein
MKNARQYLISIGVRPSVQRVAVMDYLLTHRTHPTAEEIYEALSPQIATLSKMTVYNTLRILTAAGAALSIDIEGRTTHYDGDTSFHAHFLCRHCGHIEDIPIADPEPFTAVATCGTIDDMQFLLKGACRKCAEQEGDLIA